MHVLVRNEVRGVEELRGKKVHFATGVGSTASLTGPMAVPAAWYHPGSGRIAMITWFPDRLKSGEPGRHRACQQQAVRRRRSCRESGVKLLPIPLGKFDKFTPSANSPTRTIPTSSARGERIDTIAVRSLAVYNWPKNTDRYRRVERFCSKRLFANWSKLQKLVLFHPELAQTNLAATVPGWSRFVVAEQQLQALSDGSSTRTILPRIPDFPHHTMRSVNAASTAQREMPRIRPCFANL